MRQIAETNVSNAREPTLLAIEREVRRLCAETVDESLKTALADVAAQISQMRLAGDVPQFGDVRTELRSPTLAATYVYVGDERLECALNDLSLGGALIQCDGILSPDTLVYLSVPGVGELAAMPVATSEFGTHIRFLPLPLVTETALIQAVANHYDA